MKAQIPLLFGSLCALIASIGSVTAETHTTKTVTVMGHCDFGCCLGCDPGIPNLEIELFRIGDEPILEFRELTESQRYSLKELWLLDERGKQ